MTLTNFPRGTLKEMSFSTDSGASPARPGKLCRTALKLNAFCGPGSFTTFIPHGSVVHFDFHTSVHAPKRKWAHLLGGASVRVPVGPAAPDFLAGGLCLISQRGHIDVWNAAAFHADNAIHDDGIDVVTDAAINQALDRIAHRTHSQRIPSGHVDNDDIGAGARCEPPNVGAPQRACPAQGRCLEDLAGGRSL